MLKSALMSAALRLGYEVQRFEPACSRAAQLRAILAAQRINLILDVGANIGQFGRELRRHVGYVGRIVSFEPSPSSLPKLTLTAKQDGNWVVRPIGLSAESGEADLHLFSASVMDSLHAKDESVTGGPDFHFPDFRQTATATVHLSTLADEYGDAIAGVGTPHVLLKSDTQGHDLEVFAGAKGLAPEVVAVFVELSAQAIYEEQPSMNLIISTLQSEGFTPVAFEPVSKSPDRLRVVEFDGLFMRRPQDADAVGERVTASIIQATHARAAHS